MGLTLKPMKIDFSKALPIAIVIGAAVIIVLSGIYFGFKGTIPIVALFLVAGIVIGIDRYKTYRKNKK